MFTSMALLELIENITNALDQKSTIGVFIDLKKALDWSSFITQKKSYLHNRLQYVSIEDNNSDLLNVTWGTVRFFSGPKTIYK